MTPILLTLGQCLDAEHALTRLASQQAPPRVTHRVAKLLRLVRLETAHFYEQRDALIKELGAPRLATEAERVKGMVGEQITVTPENMVVFQTRVHELAAVQTEIAWVPLTMADLDTFASLCADDELRLGPCLIDEGEG